MLKHILTKECNRNCSYCISRNITQKQELSFNKIASTYVRLVSSIHPELMLTGGEPTMVDNMDDIIMLANSFFKKLYITSQNPVVLTNSYYNQFDAVTFSIHDKDFRPLKVEVKVPVYASVMTKNYAPNLPRVLKHLGFAGLTVNEDQFSVEGPFQMDDLDSIPSDFSFRINRVGKCLEETIILPDLSIITSFGQYLTSEIK